MVGESVMYECLYTQLGQHLRQMECFRLEETLILQDNSKHGIRYDKTHIQYDTVPSYNAQQEKSDSKYKLYIYTQLPFYWDFRREKLKKEKDLCSAEENGNFLELVLDPTVCCGSHFGGNRVCQRL